MKKPIVPMKSYFTALTVLLGLSLTAVSCSNDDEKNLQQTKNEQEDASSMLSPGVFNPDSYNLVEAFTFDEEDAKIYTWDSERVFTLACKDEYKDIVGNITDWRFFAVYDFDVDLWDVRDEVNPWVLLPTDSEADKIDLGWGTAERVRSFSSTFPVLKVTLTDLYSQGRYDKIIVYGLIDGRTAYTGTIKVKRIPDAGSTTPVTCYYFTGHDEAVSPEGEDFYLDVKFAPEGIEGADTPDQARFTATWGIGLGRPADTDYDHSRSSQADHVDFGWFTCDRENAAGTARFHIVFGKNDTGKVRRVQLHLAGNDVTGEEVSLGVWGSYAILGEELILTQNPAE